MFISNTVRRRGLAAVAAVIATLALSAPNPANAQRRHHGGIGPGAAIGLGLGSLALGTALGAGAFAQPYGGYPYGYYAPAPAYYPPAAPVYSYPRTCWYPQYGGYYAC